MRVIHSPLLKMHIDLDSISVITDAHLLFENEYYVGFEVHCKLHDKPITYARRLLTDEKKWDRDEGTKLAMAEGTWVDPEASDLEDVSGVLAVQRLDEEIEGLIEQWKELT